jgi:hypothetical protein
LSPTLFWLSASTTVIVASLGGFYALHVKDLYDQAKLKPPVSPERTRLHAEMKHAELTADVLLLGSLALAAGSTVLAWHVDWSGRELRLFAAGSGAAASLTLDPAAARPPPRAATHRSWW